jgi:formate-dependent nitrite reductase membrane component NrfD
MNPSVVSPEWGWWIIGYFFLGGIAAGAYFTATLIDLTANEENSEVARVGYWIAFPLVLLCGAFLTLDLNQPERFWHMLLRSEVVHEALDEGWPWTVDSWSIMIQAPHLKYWSPMSIGSWALLLFGVCSFLSLLGSLWREGRLARLLRRSSIGRGIQVIGCLVGFFVAAYPGALLTATNQRLWSETDWIAPLFLTSAASTGLAVLVLLSRLRRATPAEALHRLDSADLLVVILEAIVFAIFLLSIRELLPPLWASWQGILFLLGTGVLSIVLPLALHLARRWGWRTTVVAALLALAGGFVLRYGIVTTSPELLASGPEALAGIEREAEPVWGVGFSPEDQRPRGADSLNRRNRDRPDEVKVRSKFFKSP